MSEDVKIKYDEIKKKKTHRYCVFFIKDEKLIAVEKIGKLELGISYFEKWGMILVFKSLFQEAYVPLCAQEPIQVFWSIPTNLLYVNT